jgi:N-acetylneuraminate lyase
MDKVIAIIRVLVQYGGVAAGKLAMQLHGIDVGDPRRPLRPMTSEQKRVALDAFALPILFNR